MRVSRSLLSILLVFIIAFAPSWALASRRVAVTVKGGPLGFTHAGASSLAEVILTGYDQTTTGGLGTIDISDARGTGAGWSLILQADDFVNADSSGATIPADGFTVDGTPTVTTVAGKSPPQAFSGALGDPLRLLAADPATGMGRFQTDPGLSLVVPADTIAGTYETTVTMTITSSP